MCVESEKRCNDSHLPLCVRDSSTLCAFYHSNEAMSLRMRE